MKLVRLLGCFIQDEIAKIGCMYGGLAFCGLVFRLYHVKKETILYSVFLCGVIYLLYFICDFVHYSMKYVNRQRLLEKPEYMSSYEDEADSQMERDYREVIVKLIHSLEECEQQYTKKYHDDKDYMTMWAHQIKTPITAMSLILQQDFIWLSEDKMEGERRKYLASMKGKLFEIQRYVDMTMQYVRMDSLTSDLQLEALSLEKCVKDAVRYYSQYFIMKKLSISVDLEGAKVVSDEKWLVFVLKQILSNAVKYTEKGGITIWAEEEKTALSRKVILHIKDSGCGIAEEDLPRIFEKAFTGFNGRMDKKATGIGLYLSKTIMNRLGHDIRITSKEGEGTTVQLIFTDEVGE